MAFFPYKRFMEFNIIVQMGGKCANSKYCQLNIFELAGRFNVYFQNNTLSIIGCFKKE